MSKWADLYVKAMAQAVKELKFPPRGLRGSRANKIRQKLGPKLAARVKELLSNG
jgi:hypothetical protein